MHPQATWPHCGGLHGTHNIYLKKDPVSKAVMRSWVIPSFTQWFLSGPALGMSLYTRERRERQTYVSRPNTEDLTKELLTCPLFRYSQQTLAFARQKFSFSLQWFVAELQNDFIKKKIK